VCKKLEVERDERDELKKWIQDNMDKTIHKPIIPIQEKNLENRENKIVELEKKEQDIILKFEIEMINVLSKIDIFLEEIGKECAGESKLKLVLMIDGLKA
jgi:hypothetical protein